MWVRRGAVVAVLLVVGAVVNVGVAWGCVLWMWPRPRGAVPSDEGDLHWYESVPVEWPVQPNELLVDLGPTWSMREWQVKGPKYLWWEQFVLRAGWPMHSCELVQLNNI